MPLQTENKCILQFINRVKENAFRVLFKKNDDKYFTTGILNMMGESKNLIFSFDHKGITKNRSGSKVAIFEGTFEIDRTNFGMEHVVSVGDIVTINFYCELIEDIR